MWKTYMNKIIKYCLSGFKKIVIKGETDHIPGKED